MTCKHNFGELPVHWWHFKAVCVQCHELGDYNMLIKQKQFMTHITKLLITGVFFILSLSLTPSWDTLLSHKNSGKAAGFRFQVRSEDTTLSNWPEMEEATPANWTSLTIYQSDSNTQDSSRDQWFPPPTGVFFSFSLCRKSILRNLKPLQKKKKKPNKQTKTGILPFSGKIYIPVQTFTVTPVAWQWLNGHFPFFLICSCPVQEALQENCIT